MITEGDIQQEYSFSYLKAIAANAGVIFRDYRYQDYGIDGCFADVKYDDETHRRSESGFGIDVQVKATTNLIEREDGYYYDLEIKNYNDLRETNVGKPRILIVYSMPHEREDWIHVGEEEMILRKNAWWCSLKGEPIVTNGSTKRVRIPKDQKIDAEEIIRMMTEVKSGNDL
jgi:hypothetical protein